MNMFNTKRFARAAVAGVLVLFVVLGASCTKKADDKPAQQTPSVESLFAVQLNNFEFTLSQIDQFLAGVSPIPMGLQMLVRMQLAGALGSPELTGVNMTGSFAAFGVLMPAESPDAKPVSRLFIAGLMPVTDYDKFISGNSKFGKPDDKGVSTITIGAPAPPVPPAPGAAEISAKGPAGPKMLVTRFGAYALITSDSQYDKLIEYKKLMAAKSSTSKEPAQLAGVADSSLVQQASKEPIWVYGNVQAASNAFGPLLLEKLEEGKKALEQMSAAGQGPVTNPAAIMDMYKGALDVVMKEVKSFTLAVKPSPQTLFLTETISAVPGTDTAGMLVADAAASKENELLGYLQDRAAMNFAFKMNSPFWKKFTVKMMDLFVALIGQNMSAEDIAKIKTLAADSIDAMGGSMAGALSIDPAGKPPVAMKYVVAVKDADKFNKMFDESVDLINTTGIGDIYKNLGIKLDYTLKRNADSYNGVSIDSAKLVIKSTEPNSPAGRMTVTEAMYGGGLEYRWGLVDGLCAIAIGGDADSAVRQLIDQIKAGGPKEICSEVQDALKMLPEAGKADFFVTYNYVRVLKMAGIMMPDITGTGMKMPQVDVPSKSNINIAGKIADGKVVVDIAVPKQHLAELVSAVMIMQQQMQSQMSVTSTKTTMATLATALDRFKLDVSRYPTDEEGLMALVRKPGDITGWNGPYLDGSYMPKDAWNKDFIYDVDPSGKAVIISLGADGKEGGEGLNADLRSTDPE